MNNAFRDAQVWGIWMVDEIGAAIKASRKSQGLSLAELSSQAGISRGTLTQIETGSGNPRLSSVLAVTRVLGLSFRVTLHKLGENLPEYPPGSW